MSSMSCSEITGLWTLKDAHMPKDAGSVFSCFSCAGGSTMGYKLAGFDVIGCNEIDPKVFAVYNKNHKPKFPFVCSIRDMLDKDLPDELYNLDILDGSPPCTSFSTAGVRERDWGKTKKFSEGQAYQRLDDLFFEFIALAAKLKPKIVIAENVTGIVKGKAKGYVKEIIKAFKQAGFSVQIFNFNAAQMGVPQARQRVFFVARRDDLQLKPIHMKFNEKPITFGEVSTWPFIKNQKIGNKLKLSPCLMSLWPKCKQGNSLGSVHPRGMFFTKVKLSNAKPAPTLTASADDAMHSTEPRNLTTNEWIACSSFPIDMQWGAWAANKAKWAMGMSVPPFMIQRIALQVRRQWGHALGGIDGTTD
jgi:DNA (cytosine-5)-methyltransferase 1